MKANYKVPNFLLSFRTTLILDACPTSSPISVGLFTDKAISYSLQMATQS